MSSENTLRTLKDLTFYPDLQLEPDMIRKSELKAEAVKWVKEEMELNNNQIGTQIDRWMERLDIKEEDLK